MSGSNLSIHILGDGDQGIIPEFEFYPGEDRTLKFQIYDTVNEQKYPIPSTGLVATLTIPSMLATDIVIPNASITQDATDLSVFSVELTGVNTTNMMTGWLTFTFTVPATSPATTTRIAYAEFALKKLSF